MLNQVVMVGRIKKIDYSNKILEVTVPRTKGQEKDDIPCELGENLINNINEYCEENDLVGIKGSLIVKDGVLIVATQKVTFLSKGKLKGGETNDSK